MDGNSECTCTTKKKAVTHYTFHCRCKKKKEDERNKKQGIFHHFLHTQRRKEKEKKEKKKSTFVLPCLPFLLRTSSLPSNEAWTCLWHFPSQFKKKGWNDFNWIQYDLNFKLMCEGLFYFAPYQMCCYGKLVAVCFLCFFFQIQS